MTGRIPDSGITREAIVSLKDTDSEKALVAHLEAHSTFDGLVREVEEEARKILRTAPRGLGGLLKAVNGSPEWYADQIMWHIQITRSLIENGDAQDAARWSFLLGEIVCQARMKEAWESLVLIGAKSQIGAGEGGRERARKKAAEKDQRNMKMAEQYLTEINTGKGRRSKSKIKEDVGKRMHNLGRSQAIAAIDNGLRLLDR
jgi:hypothetical protein